MGVQGLWALLEPAGKPIPLETLENKVLAIDVSIWLNAAVKGYRDQEGGTVANAHILGLFHRICKLLFYKIRPIFVFDGKAPQLKLDTLRRRRNVRSNLMKKSDAARAKILDNFIKRNVVASQLQRQTFAVKKALEEGQDGLLKMIQQRKLKDKTGEQKDMFELPPLPQQGFALGASSQEDDSSEDEDDWKAAAMAQLDMSDIHSLDVTSQHFQSLPTEIQFELLADIKQLRKQSSWDKMSEMPRKADDFSGYQMQRLVKRNQVQKKLCEVGKQLGQEAAEGLDASLFVGDKQGLRKNLKKELKKVASSQDGTHIMYISGLNELKDGSSEEFNSEISQDDLLKITEMDKVKKNSRYTHSIDDKQNEIDLRECNEKSSSDSESSPSENDFLDILEPSSQGKTSNRTGGIALDNMNHIEEPCTSNNLRISDTSSVLSVKQSHVSNDDTGIVIPIEIKIPVTEDEYMSTSDESDDDMFADVFANPSNVTNLDQILETARPDKIISETYVKSDHKKHSLHEPQVLPMSYSERMTPRTAKQVSFLQNAQLLSENNKPHDMYAQIAKQSQSNPRRTSFDGENNGNGNLGVDIVNSMKKSDQIWLKKASKWVEEKVVKSSGTVLDNKIYINERCEKNIRDAGDKPKQGALLDWERQQLITEMKQSEREARLIKIKSLSEKVDVAKKVIKSISPRLSNKDCEEADGVLSSLGVQKCDKSEIEQKVMEEEGWIEGDTAHENGGLQYDDRPITTCGPSDINDKGNNEQSVVYGDSVEGFVTTKKYKVLEASKEFVNSDFKSDAAISKFIEINPTTNDKPNYDNIESQTQNEFSEKELFALQEKLAQEHQMMVAEQKKAERFAATLTDQMYEECQQLLQLFGIPWVVSPGEAEAQCAFLDGAGLSNGIITDDSDIWVFGGKNVFKNFFDRDRYCESFCLNEITKHFGLTREKMVQVAMLTGSDYTEGITDVGPVTSMEILAEFPGEGINPLTKFSEWWKEINGSLKVESKIVQVTKTRERFKRFHLPQNFPSTDVFNAYMNPIVDTSTEKFSWAVPNFIAIRDYTSEKFGWSKGKTDQILKPVIKTMSSDGKNAEFQSRIDNYFQSERIVLPKKGSKLESSKRVQEAIEKVLNKECHPSQCTISQNELNTETTGKNSTKNKKCREQAKCKDKKTASKRSCEPNEKAEHALKPSVSSVSFNIAKNSEISEKEKKALAKQKAIEIYQKTKTLKRKQTKSSKSKSCSPKKSSIKTSKRRVLTKHNLSESDEDSS